MIKTVRKKEWDMLLELTEKNRKVIEETAWEIWNHPEIGYKEWKTSQLLEDKFTALGYQIKKAGNIPGFTADLETGKPGPVIGIIAELDSLICHEHRDADRETGAVHACGHNCQSAYLIGTAAVFADARALEKLSGTIRFVSVPAEETIDMEYRNSLISQGVIHYMAGKIEFLYRGLLDGMDMGILMHADAGGPHLIEIFDGCDGCITKHFEFEGKAAHAGAAPYDGINALYEASLGLQACNALRETFRDEDHIRFHPIITQAGVAANAIPYAAKMDAYCRAARADRMIETNGRINRALSAAAAALGGNLHLVDRPGNLPLHNSRGINELFAGIGKELFGEGGVKYGPWQAGSCDLGDLSSLMPVSQIMATGAAGTLHGNDYRMADVERLCVNPVRLISIALYELLSDDGKLARSVIDEYAPVFASKEDYFAMINSIEADCRTVIYNEDGSILLKGPF